MELNQIYNIDALEGLKQLDENSIDAIISDPPYQLTSTRVYGKETPISEISNQLKDNVEENTAYGSLIKGFMNKSWDTLPSVEVLKECLRVLKFGAWAMWLMTPRQDSQLEFLLRLRQAGFNISFSSVEWVYASGFPKAADLSLLADKKACREDLIQKLGKEPTKEEFKEAWGKWREVVGKRTDGRYAYSFQKENAPFVVMNKEKGIIANTESIGVETNPHSQEAQALNGSYAGMQLKPARELIIVSQKPIAGKTYLDQALLYLKEPDHNQLGGTWLDDGRIPYQSNKDKEIANSLGKSFSEKSYDTGCYHFNVGNSFVRNEYKADFKGRFPANLLVSDNALDIGVKHSVGHNPNIKTTGYGSFGGGTSERVDYRADTYINDSGDLSRYFDLDFWFENKLKELPKEQQKIFPFLYVPKASKSERNEGLENIKDGIHGHGNLGNSKGFERFTTLAKNIHPTVKPIKLMSYLISLATREGDVVLDPFIGSGTTAIASILLNRKFIGFEKEKEYYDIANARLKEYMKQTNLIENPDVMKIKNRVDKPHEDTGGGFTIIHMDKITDKKD